MDSERSIRIPDSILNEYMNIKWLFWKRRLLLPQYDELARKELNLTNVPPIEELEKEISMFFLNTHFSSELPRSLPPFVVQVGGMHCKEAKGISDQVNDFLQFYDFIYPKN
jgi:UDP-glucoronosyl and UDP-glucosyl transferase